MVSEDPSKFLASSSKRSEVSQEDEDLSKVVGAAGLTHPASEDIVEYPQFYC